MVFENFLKMKIEKNVFSFRGPPPQFSAHGRSRSGQPQRPPLARPAFGLAQRRARPAPALRRAVPVRRVLTSARARPPRGDHAPATPAAQQPRPASPSNARLLLPTSAVLPTPLPHSLSSSDHSSSSSHVHHELRHQLPRRIWLTQPPQLAGDHSISPAAPPSPRARVTSPW